MKKSFLLTVGVCLLWSLPSLCQDPFQVKPNFRSVKWGASMKDIIKAEGAEPQNKSKSSDGLDVVGYQGKAGNLDCLYAYYFAEDQLVRGRYIFITPHSGKNLYIDDFRTVSASLTEKYGSPITDQAIWKENLYKNDPSEWGMAVAVGHLILDATWYDNFTNILHRLSGDNFKFTHIVQYESAVLDHVALMKKAEENAKKIIW